MEKDKKRREFVEVGWDRKDVLESCKECRDGRVKFEEVYWEELKECGCESGFKDKFDGDFGKGLELWEWYYLV